MVNPEDRVMGIDLSLTATGLATNRGLEIVPTKPADGSTISKAAIILWRIKEILEVLPITLAVVERGFSSGRGRDLETGKLHGVVEWDLCRDPHRSRKMTRDGQPSPYWIEYKLDTIYVPPSSLKKFATGKGNANKLQMVIAARERLSLDIEDDNLADAAWLREMGLHIIGHPTIDLPKKHLEAIDGIDQHQLEGIRHAA